MCLGAIYWARPKTVYFACTRADAAAIEFDDDFIYQQVPLPTTERSIPFKELLREEALGLFKQWSDKMDKTPY